MDDQATYRIQVYGRVSEEWAQMQWGLDSILITAPGEGTKTELLGEVTDQAALLGVLNTLYSFGYSLFSVQRITRDETTQIQA